MKKDELFIREFIVGLGFVSGLWIAVGINPESLIIEQLVKIGNTLTPKHNFGFLLILPSITTLISIISAWFYGGVLGMIAILLAFISGILIIHFTMIASVFLMLSLLLASLSVDNNYTY
ncbi:hypothetical protein [Methanohalophilus halophilus]|uniref:Uncharacterized protein n=1 Tax=Methanohalophilus halophilus TaxID=2177 RepID=A0A1L3Q018_9EURY|nr:hypothetical protein [Methanohalophilus halophilus]APH38227.1 hypothetical protein BHR79_01160 [Methanohalophilus halophilus]RNI10906.1 hypothetical protein EFE40_01630 [Methanohalophilus halophilus]SDV99821.1 hypothetical protein SAMN04515625_0054 [Methanohalophilus halophilus]